MLCDIKLDFCDILRMYKSIDSSIDADVIPGAAIGGFHAVADIHEVPLAQLWPGLDVGILGTSP